MHPGHISFASSFFFFFFFFLLSVSDVQLTIVCGGPPQPSCIATTQVIVHPPPPVLDVIRDTTLRFTEALRGRVHGIRRRKEWRHSESGAHLLHFLSIDRRSLFQDTGPDSMEPAALRLRPEYVLDGTHMSPAYLGALQAALDEMYVES